MTTFSPRRSVPTEVQRRTERRLYAIAIEKGRARVPDIIYTHADSREDVLANLVAITNPLPRHSRVVAVGEAWGYFHDERGDDIVV